MVLCSQLFADFTAVVIPGSGHWMRGCADDRVTRSKWRLIQKTLVGINLAACGVVNCYQANLVDIVDLFHRLAEPQAEQTIPRAKLRPFHLDPFIRVGVILRGGRNPMADNGS